MIDEELSKPDAAATLAALKTEIKAKKAVEDKDAAAAKASLVAAKDA